MSLSSVGSPIGQQTISAAQAANMGTNTSNLYINIGGQGTGTLAGKDVDSKLIKADRLLAFSEKMVREVNAAAENILFSAGEIDASWVYVEILRTQASIYAQTAFYGANNIETINVYRADIINGKLTVTEEIDYSNCIITSVATEVVGLEGKKLDTLTLGFRFTQRKDILYFFDQEGKPLGQNVSLISFPQGTLNAPGGNSGGGPTPLIGGGGGTPPTPVTAPGG